MTERLNVLPEPVRGRPPLYPWDEWLQPTGDVLVLRRGRDFDQENTGKPKAASMRALVKKAAGNRGGVADCQVPDENTVYVHYHED